MIKTRFIGLCLLGVVAFSGCYYDNEEDLYPQPEGDLANTTYSEHIAPLIQQSCAISGCHVPDGLGIAKDIKLSTYTDLTVKIEDGSFRREVIIDETMPPSFTLDRFDLERIKFWLDNDAPNN